MAARVISIRSDDWTRLGDDYEQTNSFIKDQLAELSRRTKAEVPVCAFQDEWGGWSCGEGQCCTHLHEGMQGAAPDASGMCVLQFDIPGDGSNLGSAVVNGIDSMLKYGTFDAYARVRDDGDPSTLDTSCFLERVEALNFRAPPQGQEARCTPEALPADINGVGYNNGFSQIAVGFFQP